MLNDLGIWGHIIRIVWFASGLVLVAYSHYKERKFSVAYIFMVMAGPLCWSYVGLYGLTVKIWGKKVLDSRMVGEILFGFTLIPWAALGIWLEFK